MPKGCFQAKTGAKTALKAAVVIKIKIYPKILFPHPPAVL